MNHESFYTGFISSVLEHHREYFQGLLREDDLEHFDEDFRKNFKARQADIFSEDGWDGE